MLLTLGFNTLRCSAGFLAGFFPAVLMGFAAFADLLVLTVSQCLPTPSLPWFSVQT
jgi:hypothetical protein